MTIRARNAHGDETEAAFQHAVIGLARVYGWRCFHAPDNRPGLRTGRPQALAAPEGKGFPDLVLVRGAALIFAELKTRTGRVSAQQREWLEALEETECEVYVWRPADWDVLHMRLSSGQRRRTDLDDPFRR